ncbi:MAG: ATP-binding protein [Actinobacteria bacterium]|nr:MAG: ATP-binding protein [Actinomycetota bacterium]
MSRREKDSLLEFVSSVAGEQRLKVEENLGDGYVRLRVSEAERRQAKHDIRCVEDAVIELLRNSRDAGSRCIFLATSRDGALRRIVCIDDGEGIPEHMHEAVFEPRVTSKLDSMTVDSYGVHGRGMALYSIKSNVRKAEVISSFPDLGSCVLAEADTKQLAERKDQSTWPEVLAQDEKRPLLKGPHNILRCAADFALSHPGVELFVGSPSEVLATMRHVALRDAGMSKLFDEARLGEVPLWQRVARAVEPGRLVETAWSLYAMPISERNAQRLLSGDIPPVLPVSERLGMAEQPAAAGTRRAVDLVKDRRSVKIEAADLDTLARAALEAFEPIAKKYFLHEDVRAQVSATSEELRIRLPLRKQE